MEYELMPSKRNKLELYSKLLSEVFTDTKKFTLDFLDWQYFKNPVGDVVGFDAFYNNELVAHYVTIPVVYKFNDKTLNGLLSLNTATKAEHQGKGLFTKLASDTYDLAKEKGYKFIIGVANQNSTHGFIKKLGFDLVGKLDVKIYLGTIQQKKDNKLFFKAIWTKDILEWRLKNPDAIYFSKRTTIYSATHIPFIKSLLLTTAESKVEHIKSINFIPFKLSIGLNIGDATFAINLPERFKPSPLNLIFKNISGDELKISKDNCYFELIDFDAY